MTADAAMDHHPMPGAKMNGSAPSHSTCTDVRSSSLEQIANHL